MEVTLGDLAVRFGCELRGDPSSKVNSVGSLAHAGPQSITFLANPKYAAQLRDTRAGAVILDAKSADASPVPALVAPNPHATYARIAVLLHPEAPLNPGVHGSAVVAAGAAIDSSAEIGAQAFIAAGVRVGARCYIGPGCVVQRGAVLGDDTRLIGNVFVGPGVVFGARVVAQPGAVVGADGFGFASEKGTWVKVPQLGTVIIGDDAEIGANTTIDRGALGDTVIEDGVKLDNLIMIAHNCHIGAHTAIAACSGIAGSAVLGKRCIIGGKVGIVGHLSLCDDVVVLGNSMISRSIYKPGVYSSALPSEEAGVWRRLVARFKGLDAMAKRLRALEKHAGISTSRQDSSED